MRALRSVANADDEGIANEDGGLTIADLSVSEMGWARHHEQLVAIDVELWQLVSEECVLDRQRVQVVILLELAQLRLARLEQSDPDKFGAIGCTADRLIERDRADPLAIAIETGGDDAHRGRLSEAPRDAAAAHDRDRRNVRSGRQHDVFCGRPTTGFVEVTSWGAVSGCGTMRLGRSAFNSSVGPSRRAAVIVLAGRLCACLTGWARAARDRGSRRSSPSRGRGRGRR